MNKIKKNWYLDFYPSISIYKIKFKTVGWFLWTLRQTYEMNLKHSNFAKCPLGSPKLPFWQATATSVRIEFHWTAYNESFIESLFVTFLQSRRISVVRVSVIFESVQWRLLNIFELVNWPIRLVNYGITELVSEISSQTGNWIELQVAK